MIGRYETLNMRRIWSEENKCQKWLDVELAILQAKARLNIIHSDIFSRTTRQAKFTLERIDELDLKIHHDLLAFVQTVQENLDADLRSYFHQDVTSYDTQEPATALLIRSSIEVIFRSLNALMDEVKRKALKYKHLVKIHRTHGQHAEPTTLGLEFLWWYDALERQADNLDSAYKEIRASKISGAVGTYAGGLSPEIEAQALGILGLSQAKASAQILLRDRHAQVMNALAILAGVLEHISLNLRLMGQTEICEVQEPFGKSQKGSSRMPHKRNTILSENLCGLARIVRSNAAVALENIPTWSARDISHSSAERIIFPDSFHAVDFMLLRLIKIFQGLVVNEERITENLNMTRGNIFSPEVKELLMAIGTDPEAAYRISQQTAFQAWEENRNYLDVLLKSDQIPEELKGGKLQAAFDMTQKVRYVDEVFSRFKM
ncbi:MAG TPA: adenylosuccinate lyase [Candidatus Bathyarchaeia archaeon]|nr:adenylosuccinate lyase [Candidatus Bathyarchaeia archaeon]